MDLFKEYAADYDRWYETPLGSMVEKLEYDLFYKIAKPKAGEKALDAGCGTGRLALDLAGKGVSVTGIDTSEAMLAIARSKVQDQNKVQFLRGNMEAIPAASETFTLVIAFTSLEFTGQPEAAVRELWRMVRPGGRLIVAALNAWSPWAWWRSRKTGHSVFAKAHFFSPWELLRLLARNTGERCLVWNTAVFIPPGANSCIIKTAPVWEVAGRLFFKPLGALIIVRVDKTRVQERLPELNLMSKLAPKPKGVTVD
ncbi:MAG: methyltransferase domain-containing protein [Peptococcaceae bacterium]|nr:methyltransferase domain-containing protein [Peptococcaceae bacterium]